MSLEKATEKFREQLAQLDVCTGPGMLDALPLWKIKGEFDGGRAILQRHVATRGQGQPDAATAQHELVEALRSGFRNICIA